MISLEHYNPGLRGTMTVVGSKKFKVPTSDFILSPLSSDGVLHLNSICNGVENDVSVATINSGNYTKIEGAVPYMEFYVETSETFYIKW